MVQNFVRAALRQLLPSNHCGIVSGYKTYKFRFRNKLASKRGDFYDKTGALRDMVQNHLLQLVSIVAMEPPVNANPDAIRDEKSKSYVLYANSLPMTSAKKTVRGQYRALGAVDGKPVIGYQNEPGVPASSRTETFVAIRAEIDNWRWAGVPFYLRTGKRMASRCAKLPSTSNRFPTRFSVKAKVPCARIVW